MPININAKLVKKEILKDDIIKFSVEAEEMADKIKPGQFIEIRVTDTTEPFLRRPISIYNVDGNIVEFIFQVKGKGTEILARKEEGDLIDIIGPLGNGPFLYEKYKNIAIIGGGIGIFPLHELAKRAKETANVTTYLGFRNKDFVVLEDEYKNVSNELVITTDDGSYGIKGFAINELKKDMEDKKFDAIFACGPLPMLKAVKEFAIENKVPCQISLEEKMGCGLGACLGCAVQVAGTDPAVYVHVCKAGPVFEARGVEI